LSDAGLSSTSAIQPNERGAVAPPTASDQPLAELPRRATIPPDVLFQHVGERVVLLSLKGDKYYSMNQVGSRIWSLLADRSEVQDVLQTMAVTYQVDASDLRRDLARFLERLASAGLVELA
jgi:hypothetical protein